MSDEQKCPECNGFRGLPRMLHDEDSPRECSNAFHKTSDVIPFPEQMQEKQPATAPTEAASAPKVPDPVCPYCGADPCNLKARTLKMGPFDLMLVRCANDECRKTLAVFPVGINSPAQMGPPGGFLQ